MPQYRCTLAAVCVCVCVCVCNTAYTHKHTHNTGQGTISWNTGRSFQGRFAEDCPITGELTELDGNVYSVAYAGNLKFHEGAKPVSQELISTKGVAAVIRTKGAAKYWVDAAAEGLGAGAVRPDAFASNASGGTAPEPAASLHAHGARTAPAPATSSVPASGAAATAAGGEAKATEVGPSASQWDDWEPFHEIVPIASPAAAAATAANVGRPAPIECNTQMSRPEMALGPRRQAASDCESEDSS